MKKSIFLFFAAILCAVSVQAEDLFLRGDFNSWGSGTAEKFTNGSGTVNVVLTANTTYKFLVANSGWGTKYGTADFTADATKKLTKGGADMSIKTTLNGTYTFTFDVSTMKLTVTYPTEEVPVETHDITVKAKYPATWTAGKAAIHFWATGVASPGTPAAMTKDGDWWTYTVTGVPTTSPLSVIFINGETWNGDKNQTVDITGITENTCFEVSQSGSAKGTAVKANCETGEGEVIETHDITVKAFYPASWNAGKAAVHFWGDGVTGATPAAMTKDGDWWSYTVTGVPTTSELSVIFINGDNWNGDANQTVDITGIKESTCYQITSGSGKASAAVVDCASTPVVAEDVYTVVGSDVLLGTAWDLNNADNEMTKQDDGSYVLVKENVDLATTGTYEYKVVKNHDWGWSVPSGNANQTLKLGNEDVDGTYNVTFTLNKELNALTASLELVEAKKVIPECYIAGDESLTGQDWNAKSVLMTYDEATEVYTATLTAVPAGTHNMKVVYGGEWLGFDHLATPAPANVKEGDDKKIQFTLAEAGDVTVTYHATNGINITGNFAAPAPEVFVTLYFVNADNWANVKAYVWILDGAPYKAWDDSEALTDTGNEHNGAKIYSYTFPEKYNRIIFKGDDNKQTTDDVAAYDVAKPYYYQGVWYASLSEIPAPVEDYYTIVGATAITGVNWDPANEDNKMTKDGEVYTLTKTGLQLEAGDYEYKVAKNGAWGNGDYPAEGNQKVTIAENGVYTIVYTYTVGTSLTAVPEKTGDYTPDKPVYTVAGDAALCGTNWKADDTDNDMTDNGDGTFTWTKTGVKLTGDAGFKVVKNHDFANDAYPAENWVIKIADHDGAAIYTVTITFTESSKDIAVTLTKTGDATPAVITYVLMGVNGDWDNGIALTQNPGNADEYVLENQVIIKATDAIKVVTLTDGTATAWCGNVDTWSNATYTADGDGNIVLEDGIYTFYFKKNDDLIYINQTGYVRNVTNKYGTICLPYASKSTTGATFYRVAGKETGKVYLESVDDLQAGVPYIFEKTANANQIKVVYTGDKETTAGNANGLVGTFTEIEVPNDAYILYGGAFCTNNDEDNPNKIKANHAYLDLSAVQGGKPNKVAGRRYIGMDVQGENEATGFENIVAPEGQTIKAIVNGQLVIIRGNEMYNAQGQKL